MRIDSPQQTIHSRPHHIIVVGGSYGGLATVVSLLALADGKELPNGGNPMPGLDTISKQGLRITLIDERDGFCTSYTSFTDSCSPSAASWSLPYPHSLLTMSFQSILLALRWHTPLVHSQCLSGSLTLRLLLYSGPTCLCEGEL